MEHKAEGKRKRPGKHEAEEANKAVCEEEEEEKPQPVKKPNKAVCEDEEEEKPQLKKHKKAASEEDEEGTVSCPCVYFRPQHHKDNKSHHKPRGKAGRRRGRGRYGRR